MRAGALGHGSGWVLGALLMAGLSGCPGDTELAEGDASQGSGSSGTGGNAPGAGRGGSGGSGDSGSSGGNAGSGDSGSSGGNAGGGSEAGSGGASGSGGGGVIDRTCPPNLPIPAICQVCPDGSCAEPECKNGEFTGFECDGGGGGSGGAGGGGDLDGCTHAGCSSQLCVEASEAGSIGTTCEFREEYACYQQAECARKADGECGFTESAELSACLDAAGAGGGLRWYALCGDPVCSVQPDEDDPAVANCTGAMSAGSPCTDEGARCQTLSCGVDHVCAATDPIGNFPCPISRARYKRDVDYVDDQQLQSLHDQITAMPLATWQYKHQPGVPQLGFIIEDIEPSPAVAGDHVNVYGYLSMAVAAIQVQQRQIEALQGELAALREGRTEPSTALTCGP